MSNINEKQAIINEQNENIAEINRLIQRNRDLEIQAYQLCDDKQWYVEEISNDENGDEIVTGRVYWKNLIDGEWVESNMVVKENNNWLFFNTNVFYDTINNISNEKEN